MNIYIVIPAHNEASRITKVLKSIKKYKLPTVVVDDGSTDTTLKKLHSINNTSNKNLTILSHKINLGKGAAMKTGAEAAFLQGADAIIFMDADGQHSAKDLPKFLKAFRNKKCVFIIGSRNLGYGVPIIRYLGNKFASVLVSLLFGPYVSDLLSGYRGMTKAAYKKIKWESTGYGAETEMDVNMSKINLKHCEVPIATLYYDEVKGVTMLDAVAILLEVVRWRFTK